MPIVHRLARLRAISLSCAALLAALLASPVGAAPVLRDLSGQPRTIAEYTGHGKWLVVMIWASDCGVCNTEAHSYVDFYNTRRAKDASVLGISTDGWAGRADAEAFIRRHHVTFPNLIGEPEAVAELYGELTGRPWFGTPTFLIYDPGGELRVQQVGAVPVKLIEEYIRSHSTRTPGRAGAPDGAPGAGLGAVSTSCAACQQFPTRIRGVLLCPPPPRVAMLRGVNREHAILEHRGAKYTGTTGTSL